MIASDLQRVRRRLPTRRLCWLERAVALTSRRLDADNQAQVSGTPMGGWRSDLPRNLSDPLVLPNQVRLDKLGDLRRLQPGSTPMRSLTCLFQKGRDFQLPDITGQGIRGMIV